MFSKKKRNLANKKLAKGIVSLGCASLFVLGGLGVYKSIELPTNTAYATITNSRYEEVLNSLTPEELLSTYNNKAESIKSFRNTKKYKEDIVNGAKVLEDYNSSKTALLETNPDAVLDTNAEKAYSFLNIQKNYYDKSEELKAISFWPREKESYLGTNATWTLYNQNKLELKNTLQTESENFDNYKDIEAESKFDILSRQRTALDAYNDLSKTILENTEFEHCTNQNKDKVDTLFQNHEACIEEMKLSYSENYSDNLLDSVVENKIQTLTIERENLKTEVFRPSYSNQKIYIYNGKEQTIDFVKKVEVTEGITYKGTYKFKNAGKYKIRVCLTDKNKYEWKGGGQEDIVYDFEIKKAKYYDENNLQNDINFPKLKSRTYIYNGKNRELPYTESDFMIKHGITVIYNQENNCQKDPGIYNVVLNFTLKEEDLPNFEPIPPLEAKMVILATEITSENKELQVKSQDVNFGFYSTLKLTNTKINSLESFDSKIQRYITAKVKEKEYISSIYRLNYLETTETGVTITSPEERGYGNKITLRVKIPAELKDNNFKVVMMTTDGVINAKRYIAKPKNGELENSLKYYDVKNGYVEIQDVEDLDLFCFVAEEKEPMSVGMILLIVFASIIAFFGLAFLVLFILWKKGVNLGGITKLFDKMFKQKEVQVDLKEDEELTSNSKKSDKKSKTKKDNLDKNKEQQTSIKEVEKSKKETSKKETKSVATKGEPKEIKKKTSSKNNSSKKKPGTTKRPSSKKGNSKKKNNKK